MILKKEKKKIKTNNFSKYDVQLTNRYHWKGYELP